MTFDYDTYLSPYTWRYGTPEMRAIWSEENKRRLWRRIWTALAEMQASFGLVTTEQVQELRSHEADVDIVRTLEIEEKIHHDLMAELKTFAEQAPGAGGILHLGATSMDISDNAEVLRIREALRHILVNLEMVLESFAEKMDAWAGLPTIGYTHLQPAEPTTLGYRFSQVGQDLWEDWQTLKDLYENLRGKGFKGAVGTGASFMELIGEKHFSLFEEQLGERLGLTFFTAATQTYPRKQDYRILCGLAGLGATCYKFAFDLRIMSSPNFGEVREGFGKNQVGSSAMPFKQNPIRSEKVDSLARFLAQAPRLAWDNAAHSLFERTLDDSANRRTLLPEAFLITDELLRVIKHILANLEVDRDRIAELFSIHGPFAATERVLMALVEAGADRQVAHEKLRTLSLRAREDIRAGKANPLEELICEEPGFQELLSKEELKSVMNPEGYTGFAEKRTRLLAERIREAIRGEGMVE